MPARRRARPPRPRLFAPRAAPDDSRGRSRPWGGAASVTACAVCCLCCPRGEPIGASGGANRPVGMTPAGAVPGQDGGMTALTRTGRALASLVLVLALAAAGCGGDD